MVGPAKLTTLFLLVLSPVVSFALFAFPTSHGPSLLLRLRFYANKLWTLNPFTHESGKSPSVTQLSSKKTTKEARPRGHVLNLSLVCQMLLNQILIGSTIWMGGVGAQALARSAHFDTTSVLLGMASFVSLFFLSHQIETNELSAAANLNLSTNMVVLHLFRDTPQQLVAFVVSTLLPIVTGLMQKTTFQGQLLPALSTRRSSLPIGFVISTLLFALLHVNPPSLFRGGGGFKDAC